MKKVYNGNFTAVSNKILQNDKISMKARGLFITMWSLPDEWEFTIAGLTKILPEGKDAIRNTLNELEANGYLYRKQINEGKFGNNIYTLTDDPDVEIPVVGKPDNMKSNTINNTPINNTSINKKNSTKKSYGEFKNVKLTDEEYEAVKQDFIALTDRAIEILDDYIESTGKKYKSHRAVLKKNGWVWNRVKEEYSNKKTSIKGNAGSSLPTAKID